MLSYNISRTQQSAMSEDEAAMSEGLSTTHTPLRRADAWSKAKDVARKQQTENDQLRRDRDRLQAANKALTQAADANKNKATAALHQLVSRLKAIDDVETAAHVSEEMGYLDLRYPIHKYHLYKRVFDTLQTCVSAIFFESVPLELRIENLRQLHSEMIGQCQQYCFYAGERNADIRRTYSSVRCASFPSRDAIDAMNISGVLSCRFGVREKCSVKVNLFDDVFVSRTRLCTRLLTCSIWWPTWNTSCYA